MRMNLSNFKERLGELMFDAKVNPPKLAELIGCSRMTINRYLSGKKLPTVDMAVRLADFFQCTTDYLLGLVETNYTTNFKPCPPFSEQLEFLLKYYGITRYRLMKMTHFSDSNLMYWAQGKTIPTIESILKLAEVLDCPVDFVLGRSN